MKKDTSSKIAKNIVKFCLSKNKRFIFISGNGGSGKTTLSKIIGKEAGKYGQVNCLEMDDFVVDTYLRNNAIATWKDIKNKEHKGRYTTSLEASYFLQSIKAIIYNIEKGNNYYHRPKKARKGKESILLHGDAILTIIEGVGTTFLEKEKNNSISIFLVCKKSLEIDRRIKRAKAENKNIIKEIEDKFNERNSQYEAIIKPHIKEYDIILESLGDFSLNIVRDNLNISQ